MSDVIRKRLKESISSFAKIFLKNNFKYEGKITNCDDKFVELLEPGRGYKIIEIKNISSIDILEVKNG